MISQLELDSRAALCRQLAKREPAHEALWLAEAKSWSRFSKETVRGDVGSTQTTRCYGKEPIGPWSHPQSTVT